MARPREYRQHRRNEVGLAFFEEVHDFDYEQSNLVVIVWIYLILACIQDVQ